MATDKKDLLKPKSKERRKRHPLVLDYNPKLPDISKIIKEHFDLLANSANVRDIFCGNSTIPACRRSKTLKEILAPSNLKTCKPSGVWDESNYVPGCVKCTQKCDLCQHFLIESESFQSLTTKRNYKIRQRLGCTSVNVIYVISCAKCNLQYVGSTSTQFEVRFRNHNQL